MWGRGREDSETEWWDGGKPGGERMKEEAFSRMGKAGVGRRDGTAG